MGRYIKRILTLLLLIILAFVFSRLYVDWLWFKDLGYTQLFWIPLLIKLLFQVVNGTILFVFIFGTLVWIRRSCLHFMNDHSNQRLYLVGDKRNLLKLNQKGITLWLIIISAAISFTISFFSGFSGWLKVLTLIYPTPFNMNDPIFFKDLSFYFFQLPFLQIIFTSFFVPAFIITVFTIILYTVIGTVRFQTWKLWKRDAVIVEKQARKHLSLLLGIFFLIQFFGYYIDQYHLLYTQKGLFVGAGYTEINYNLPVLKLHMILCLIGVILAFSTYVFHEIRLLSLPLIINIIAATFLLGIFPTLYQALIVFPDEFKKEQTYIEQGIKMTRFGYGLDKIKEYEYPGKENISGQSFVNEQNALNNICLHNTLPLLTAYSQKQQFYPYYKFSKVYFDRYWLNGQYRQLLLSVREVSAKNIDSGFKTFENMRIKYTHGYGVVASLANAVTDSGLPAFVIRDIPVKSSFSELNIIEPQIYFGELTNNFAVVNLKSSVGEDETIKHDYHGLTGIQLTPLNRLFIAINQLAPQLFFSKQINENSIILLYPNIKERVKKIAPFLSYDDPYIVIDEGRLKWIFDGYTTSSALPYSNYYPGEELNYIRNSVKVVVDAYHGTVEFYICDESDPVIKTYQKLFPGVFKSISDLPPSLKGHLQYGKTLFVMQSHIIKNFHVTNPEDFYLREKNWDICKEIIDNEAQYVEPHYQILKLPGFEQWEFVLTLPFSLAASSNDDLTSKTSNNIVAFMVARMDGDHYGELCLYRIPDTQNVNSPQQLEIKVKKDKEISYRLNQWKENYSVQQGRTFIIPVKGDFLFVRSLYIQSKGNNSLPQLKGIILAYKDKIQISETLDSGLTQLFMSDTEKNMGSKQDKDDQDKLDQILEQIKELQAKLNQLEQEMKSMK